MSAIACAQPGISPVVTIHQLSPVASLRIDVEGGLPVEYELEISNPFDHPVTLTSVEIETVGESGAYAMKRVRHSFKREIAPHTTDSVQLRAWVQKLQENDSAEVTSPVMMRGTARFESIAGVMQSAFAARVQ